MNEITDTNTNFLPALTPNNPNEMVEQQRAIAEIQAAVLMAKQFPRNELMAYQKIMDAAKRKTLAENAKYSFPRGGKLVQGITIKAVETIAAYWGNIQVEIVELSCDKENHVSIAKASAWDIETNTRIQKTFTVPHYRDTKTGKALLTSDRDIYEMVANMGARRLRKCLEQLLPADILEDFLKECESTLTKETKAMKDRIREMLQAFKDINFSMEEVEQLIGKQLDETLVTNADILHLRGIYQAIKSNEISKESLFETVKPVQNKALDLTEKLKNTPAKELKPKHVDSQDEIDKQKRIAEEIKERNRQDSASIQKEIPPQTTEKTPGKDTKYYTAEIKKASSLDTLIELKDEIKSTKISIANKDILYSLIAEKEDLYGPPEEPPIVEETIIESQQIEIASDNGGLDL